MKKVDFSCPVCNDSENYSIVCADTIGNDLPIFNYSFSKEHFLNFRIIQCNKCSHCYASPRPENIYQNYIDIVDEAYLADTNQYLMTFNKVVTYLSKYKNEGRLLDVGCSTGLFLDEAKKYYSVEGLELSKWASVLAQKKGYQIHNCLLNDMNPPMPYDIITMWGVIEHFEHPDKEIKNINRILNKGGLVCLWTGDISSITAKILGKRWWYFQGQHIQMYTKKSLLTLFENNGFELLNMSTYPYVMSFSSIFKSLGRYPLFQKIAKPFLKNKLLKDIKITIKIPGEMFAVFYKK